MTKAQVLGFDVSGDWEGSTLALTWLDYTSFGTPALAFGAPLLAVPAAERVLFDPMEAPDAAFMQELDPVSYPGVEVAWFVPSLHIEEDGDGLPGEGETYVGVSLTFAVYVTGVRGWIGPLPEVVNGWNAVSVPFAEGAALQLIDPSSIPLSASLAPRDTYTLAGTGDGGGRAAMVSQVALLEGTTGGSGPTVWDEPVSGSWTVVLDGAPPADHVTKVEELSVDAAVEVGRGYVDSDGSGAWSFEDTPQVGMCLGVDPVGMMYISRVDNLPLALLLTAEGVPTGWTPIWLDDPLGARPTDDDMTALVLGGECDVWPS